MKEELNSNQNPMKTRLLNLIEKIVDDLPAMARAMVTMNLGTVQRSINNMSDEQLENLLDKAYEMLDGVRYGDTTSE